MSRMWKLVMAIGVGAVLVAPGCKKEGANGEKTQPAAQAEGKAERTAEIAESRLIAFQPLPENADLKDTSEAKVTLGRMLYHEARLSKNHDISCNSCHQLDKFGVDNEATSPGHKKQRGDRNSPTVYNAALHMAQFWDGREPTVEAQAKGPVLNPVEMAMPEEAHVIATLRSMPGYVDAFQKAFPGEDDPITFDNMAKAIGAFERKLITPSKWDAFLRGDKDALTDEEKIGFNAFVDSGCATCHYGPAVGGTTYQRLGAVKPWPDQKDQGRFEFTKNEADKMMFKVPGLRNIAKTGPYFHDGSVKSLDEAIRLMAEHQLGKELGDGDVKAIATWLDALTGELPDGLVKPPDLPQSTETTPKPDPS